MNRKDLSIIVIVAVVAGLIGGVVSGTVFHAGLVAAQEGSTPQGIIVEKTIRTEKLEIVDPSSGRVVGRFMSIGPHGHLEVGSRGEKSTAFIELHTGAGLATLQINGEALATLQLNGGVKEGTIHWNKIILSTDESSNVLTMVNPSRDLEARLVVQKEEGVSLALKEKGMPRTVLGNIQLRSAPTEELIKRPVSSLVFFNRNGDVIWKAPEAE